MADVAKTSDDSTQQVLTAVGAVQEQTAASDRKVQQVLDNVAQVGAAVSRVERAVVPSSLALTPDQVTTWQELAEMDRAYPGK